MDSMRGIIFSILASGFTIGALAQEQATTKLTFEEAVKIGLEKNVTLNTQKNQLEVTQAQKLSTVGSYLPGFNVTGNLNHQSGQQQNQGTGELEDLDTDYAGYQINGSYTIFNGLSRYNSLRSADKLVTAQTYQVKRSSQDVIFNVATQYLQVLLDQELLRIALENYNAQNALLEKIKASYEVGARAITDVYAQDAIVRGLDVTAIRAKNTLENDKSILAQILQLDPSQSFEAVYPTFTQHYEEYKNVSLDSLIQIALQNRPDLQQMQYQVEANKFSMRSATGRFMPSVSLFANYGSFYYSLLDGDFQSQMRTRNPSTTYGVNFTIPIFSQFQNRFQKTQTRVLYENSVLNNQNIEKTVKLDVQRAYNNYVNAIEGYNSSLIQFQSGELALQTQQESYLLGITDQAALAQSNQVFVLAASSKAQAEVTLLFQKVLLEYALGIIREESFTAN